MSGDIPKGVQWIVGSEDIETRPLVPFDEDAVGFLRALSEKLMKDRRAAGFSDVVSFAYWCRKANLAKKQKEYSAKYGTDVRVGRGLAFHVAPSNIPVVFAFSYAFSLLAGNANIVRIPSKKFEQIDIVCSAIREVIQAFPRLASRTAFVAYPTDCGATEYFCGECDARLLWGGDKTIELIRPIQTKPRCKDFTFSNRFSFAVIDGNSVLDACADQMHVLAQAFFSDAYFMDQNGCSSPRLICWLNGSLAAQRRFWTAVEDCAAQKYKIQPALVMEKYVQFCSEICQERATEFSTFTPKLTRIDLESLPQDFSELQGRGGYFYEFFLSDLSEIDYLIDESVQTVIYFGIPRSTLADWVVCSELRGIDRIVPIGKAFDMNEIWDGYDLIAEMSRVISVV